MEVRRQNANASPSPRVLRRACSDDVTSGVYTASLVSEGEYCNPTDLTLAGDNDENLSPLNKGQLCDSRVDRLVDSTVSSNNPYLKRTPNRPMYSQSVYCNMDAIRSSTVDSKYAWAVKRYNRLDDGQRRTMRKVKRRRIGGDGEENSVREAGVSLAAWNPDISPINSSTVSNGRRQSLRQHRNRTVSSHTSSANQSATAAEQSFREDTRNSSILPNDSSLRQASVDPLTRSAQPLYNSLDSLFYQVY